MKICVLTLNGLNSYGYHKNDEALQNTRHFFNIILCLISDGYKNTQFEKFYPYVVSYPHLGNSGNILKKIAGKHQFFLQLRQPGYLFYLNSLLATL